MFDHLWNCINIIYIYIIYPSFLDSVLVLLQQLKTVGESLPKLCTSLLYGKVHATGSGKTRTVLACADSQGHLGVCDLFLNFGDVDFSLVSMGRI